MTAARQPRAIVAASWRDERFRFLLAGAWNTLFGLLVFALVDAVAGVALGALGTLLVAYAIALPQAFLVQKRVVFRRAGDAAAQWRRFALANSAVFALNLALVPPWVAASGWPPLAVQAGFVTLATLASYLLHRHWSFA
jgi:putative flippase GtrA